jgi:hypothetical protein
MRPADPSFREQRSAGASPALASESSTAAVGAQGIRARAILLGLALIPINCYWIFMMEIVRYSGHPTTISLFFNAIFTLGLLLLVNWALRRRAPRWALNRAELIAVYLMVAIASAMCGHDMLEILISMLAYPARFATPENQWQARLIPYVPTWLTVSDPEAVAALYEGNSSLYAHFRPWLLPVGAWVGFIAALLFIMLCLNTLLRAQWTEREKLSFPIIELPLQMTEPTGSLFRNRLLWIGFGLAFAIDLLNGLNYLFPSVPSFQVRVRNVNTLVGRLPFPWDQLGWMNISLYPFVIGMGMLLPTDLLFSCWFFHWFWRFESVAAAAGGWTTRPGSPYITEQCVGGYFAVCFAALWSARRSLAAAFRAALGLGPAGSSREAMSYRAAVVGLVVGLGAVLGFSALGGMPLRVALIFFAFYLAISIAVTRMRAELGPPAHDLHRGGPDTLLPEIAGPAAFSRATLGMMTMFFWFNRAYRGHPMPHQLEGMRLADRGGADRRAIAWAMYLAAVLGSLAAFWAGLHIYYQVGLATKKAGVLDVGLIFGREPFTRFSTWLANPSQPDFAPLIALAAGTGIGLLLYLGKLTFSSWLFHPLGFATSSSWAMSIIWLPLLIAWAIKVSLLHYGGLRLYRQALPFFFGLILGEFLIGSLWTLIGIGLNIPTYGFWV